MKGLLIILAVLTGILGGDYNAKKFSEAEQDSILAVRSHQPVAAGRFRLEKENEEEIFRRSSVADWYVLDTMKHTRKQLGKGVSTLENERVRDAVMSPNGRYVAFAIGNNLYVHKCDFGTEVAVSKDADPDIINGVADWLYEEEFGTTALFAWSLDSKQLAFVKLDEHEVPTFSWDTYLGDGLQVTGDGYPQYTSQASLRYPKAGCKNAQASVCVYDIATKGIQRLPVTGDGLKDCYIPRLRWTESGELMVLRVNRDQTKMEVLSCNAKSTVCHPLYKEESKKYYMDYTLFDEWKWLSDGRFVVLSEKDGWKRAYLYSAQGMELKALTPEGIDVTAIYAVNEKTQTLFYQAATTPATRQIYALNLKKGTIAQLTEQEGLWSARFNNEATKAVFCYQSFTTPNTYTLCEINNSYPKGTIISKLTIQNLIEDNAEVKEAWESLDVNEPKLVQIPNAEGQKLEAMLMLPQNEELKIKNSKLPLVVMHYSGPASQRVLNRWRKRFEYALVEAGYAVLIVDTRGGDCKGRAWRNETYMSLGQKEAEDLIAAANWAAQRDDIDGSRMAIMGWSYGGYQTLYTMSQKNHPFKAGVAIAPVTEWRLYDTGYTERYMRRPQVNDRGYNEASLLNKAADLTGSVLIIHGTGDDNVHVQHTMQYIDALVQADKQFEMQLYPDDNHFLRKGNNAKHMHDRVLGFLRKNL